MKPKKKMYGGSMMKKKKKKKMNVGGKMKPDYIDLDKDQSKNLVEVLNSLEELDDVQNIFTNVNLEN